MAEKLRLELIPFGPEHSAACARILEELPDWFGIEPARREYIAGLPDCETTVAMAGDEAVGFLALRQHSEYSAEIWVMAVAHEAHRQGVGRALVGQAEAGLRARGTEYLEVKTLGPSRPDPYYAATRAFYASMGFRPLEETTAFWGEANPCLLMIKRL
jgi:ribosomal protein S18 acetylase RimI-like enzyme